MALLIFANTLIATSPSTIQTLSFRKTIAKLFSNAMISHSQCKTPNWGILLNWQFIWLKIIGPQFYHEVSQSRSILLRYSLEVVDQRGRTVLWHYQRDIVFFHWQDCSPETCYACEAPRWQVRGSSILELTDKSREDLLRHYLDYRHSNNQHSVEIIK